MQTSCAYNVYNYYLTDPCTVSLVGSLTLLGFSALPLTRKLFETTETVQASHLSASADKFLIAVDMQKLLDIRPATSESPLDLLLSMNIQSSLENSLHSYSTIP
jgi:hypothetical protein